jgi:cell division protein FtsI/penicillin-binding protein 2
MVRTRSRGAHAASHRAPVRTTRVKGARAGDSRTGEPRVSRGHLRSTRVRLAALGALVVLLVVVVAFGGVKADVNAEPAVQSFLISWAAGHYKAAAAQTTGNQASVAAQLADSYTQLGADDLSLGMGPVEEHGKAATATFHATVDLGPDGQAWDYQGKFRLQKLSSGWKVVWDPSVIVPGLHPGERLAVVSTLPPRAQLEDISGKSLSPPSLTFTLGVYPGKLHNPQATADGLANATGLDPEQLLGQIQVAPAGSFLELAQLAPVTYHRDSAKLVKVPGLIIRTSHQRLFDSIASPVTGGVGAETSPAVQSAGMPYHPGTTVGLSGLQQAYQRTLVGSSTTEVVTENQAGKVVSVLHRWSGRDGSPVHTTINAAVQRSADRAVNAASGSATIVAVRSGNGQILAAAGHTVHGMPALQPLTGRYQPGQAFTIVSAAALLAEGVQLNAPIPCLPSIPVGGQRFANQLNEPKLGQQPPFKTDFAYACRTAFAGLSLRLTAKQLSAAAAQFGLGASWQLPLPGSFAGSMRDPGNIAEVASDAVGNGTVLVSPLQMALMASIVDSGTWHPPSLVVAPDPPHARLAPLGGEVVQNLRTMMRATVATGLGKTARVSGQQIYGQVGTAQLGSKRWASWFIGYRGDVAFAAMEVTSSPSSAAAALAGAFLQHIPAHS